MLRPSYKKENKNELIQVIQYQTTESYLDFQSYHGYIQIEFFLIFDLLFNFKNQNSNLFQSNLNSILLHNNLNARSRLSICQYFREKTLEKISHYSVIYPMKQCYINTIFFVYYYFSIKMDENRIFLCLGDKIYFSLNQESLKSCHE